MLRWPVLALLLMLALGCARIYRPVALAQPQPPKAAGLTGALAPQPWGDNSRYEARAQTAGLQVAMLSLENSGPGDLDIQGLELPPDTSQLTASEATALVRQHPWLYLAYPLLPGLLALGASSGGQGYGVSDRVAFQGMALVGACIAIPNAVVAARSNQRLEAFFRASAWAPGGLRAGRRQEGLVFLRSRDAFAPISLQVRYRDATGDRRLALSCPGVSVPAQR